MDSDTIDYITNSDQFSVISHHSRNGNHNMSVEYKGAAVDINEQYIIDITTSPTGGSMNIRGLDINIEFDGGVDDFKNCIHGVELTAIETNLLKTTKPHVNETNKNTIERINRINEKKSNKSTPTPSPSQTLMDACGK